MLYKRRYIAFAAIAILTGLAITFWPLGDQVQPSREGNLSARNMVAGEDLQNGQVENLNPEVVGGQDNGEPNHVRTDVSGMFGMPIPDPWTTYSENIGAAESGNPASQFEVSKILFECKGLPTQVYLDEIVANGTLEPEFAEETQAKLDLCSGLIANIGAEKMNDWDFWLQKSAENNFPIALGRYAVFHSNQYTIDQARDIMNAVVKEDDPEKYFLILSYYANFKEDDHVGYETWLQLSCDQLPACDISEFRGAGLPPLRPEEQRQVDMSLSSIRSAIAEQRWDDVEL